VSPNWVVTAQPLPTDATSGELPTAALLIQPRDPSLLQELRHHFERSGFRVERVGDTIDVRRFDTSDEETVSHEILMHLRVWVVMHPDSIEHPGGDCLKS